MKPVKRVECAVMDEGNSIRYVYYSELPAPEIVKKIESENLGDIYEIVIKSTDMGILK